MSEPLVNPLVSKHEEYLGDESRLRGHAEAIAFPRSEADVSEALSVANRESKAVTVQGARTGITGSGVPESGIILNLSRMKRILGLRRDPENNRFYLRIQPGVLLSEVEAALKTLDLPVSEWDEESRNALAALKEAPRQFFPPDPTEPSASIGGMVSCNASGARTFKYGSTRDHVTALRVVLPDGAVVSLRRGEQFADRRRIALQPENGQARVAELPEYTTPSVKCAVGCRVAENMDLIDLFIGAEGVFGTVVEAELALSPYPPCIWGVVFFLPDEQASFRFVRALRGEQGVGLAQALAERPAAIELFDRDALALLRARKKDNPAFEALPELSTSYRTALYVEFHGQDEDSVMEAVSTASEIAEELGGSEEDAWVADSERELTRLKFFRHAVPEAVNLLIDQRRRSCPELTKLAADMAVPDDALEDVMRVYRNGLASGGLESVIFGHIGDNHVHVNIIPRTMDEYKRGKELFGEWAEAVVAMGGAVSAEHGIGKLKRDLLVAQYGSAGVDQLRSLKKALDPDGTLNRGVLFEWRDDS